MNERIRDMLEEATEVHDNWRTGHSERVVDYKVFAELIVRECARLNRKQSYELSGVIADTEQFGGFDLVCLDTVKRVEQYLHGNEFFKHFGVDNKC